MYFPSISTENVNDEMKIFSKNHLKLVKFNGKQQYEALDKFNHFFFYIYILLFFSFFHGR